MAAAQAVSAAHKSLDMWKESAKQLHQSLAGYRAQMRLLDNGAFAEKALYQNWTERDRASWRLRLTHSNEQIKAFRLKRKFAQQRLSKLLTLA